MVWDNCGKSLVVNALLFVSVCGGVVFGFVSSVPIPHSLHLLSKVICQKRTARR